MGGKRISGRRKLLIGLLKGLMLVCAALTCALVLFITIYVIARGIPNITWELLSTAPSYRRGSIGILPDILNTVYVIIAALCIVIPVGAGAAVYLTEYASNKKLVAVIEYAAETLSGIPESVSAAYSMTATSFLLEAYSVR